MAKRYDPVLGRWIYGVSDDAPEFGPVSDEPITFHFDGSFSDVGYTTWDETHLFVDNEKWQSILHGHERRERDARTFFTTAQPNPNRCKLCWAEPGECTHTGWNGVRDEEPIRIPPAERAGPAMIGDGVLRGQVTGIGWPKVLERLAAIDDVVLQLAKLHAPSLVEDSRGRLVRPECQGCFDTSGCHEEWPCESATILLRRIGLTERDLDYQLGDADDGGEGVQGA